MQTTPVRAAIFDMDGTLIDSERVIMRAWLSASAAGAEVVLVPDMREPEPALLKSVSLVLASLVHAVPNIPAWFGPRLTR